MNYRACIRSLLKVGGFLLFALVVSTLLWIALAALGDEAWAPGVLGVVLVTLVCSVLDLVALVVLLALAHIATTEQTDVDEG